MMRAGWSSRNRRIWVTDADGSNQKKLTDRGLDPTWSPDDRQIAASNREGRVFQIYLMDADGSNAKRLTKDKGEASNPAWAPDGQAIAYSAPRRRPAHSFPHGEKTDRTPAGWRFRSTEIFVSRRGRWTESIWHSSR